MESSESLNSSVALDRDALVDFCQRWHVRELSIFGSALRKDFDSESDLDFLVSFYPDAPLELADLVSMKEELESRYGRPVDLVEEEALRNPWRKREILRTSKVIYAA